MPLHLTGTVSLRIEEEDLTIEAKELTCVKAGLRLLDNRNTQHEFTYHFSQDPRFLLVLFATVDDSGVKLEEPSIETEAPLAALLTSNTLEATFLHDPDQDDEPLTPVSTS